MHFLFFFFSWHIVCTVSGSILWLLTGRLGTLQWSNLLFFLFLLVFFSEIRNNIRTFERLCSLNRNFLFPLHEETLCPFTLSFHLSQSSLSARRYYQYFFLSSAYSHSNLFPSHSILLLPLPPSFICQSPPTFTKFYNSFLPLRHPYRPPDAAPHSLLPHPSYPDSVLCPTHTNHSPDSPRALSHSLIFPLLVTTFPPQLPHTTFSTS